jgi:septum site-determining protein MinD
MTHGVVFAVAGAKGGVGKTTTSINLVAALARGGRSVLLIELDIAMANVVDFLDLTVRADDRHDPTLHEVLAGDATVEAATYDAPGGFDVVPSGTTLEGFVDADLDGLAAVVAAARTDYDVVVLDTGGGVAAESLLPIALADATILVSSPRVASIRDVEKTRDLVQHVGGLVAGIVFVRSGSGRSPDVDYIADFLEVDLLGHVPEDGAVADAQDIGQPVVIARQDSDAARAYDELGERIDELVGPLRERATGGTDGSDVGAAAGTNRTAARGDDEATLEATSPDGTGFGFVTDAGDAEPAGATSHADGATSRGRGEREPVGTDRAADGDDFERRTRGGYRVYVARDESLRGTDGVFRPMYVDTGREECCGWTCSCGSTDLTVDPMERLECGECGNRSRARRWDARRM